MFPFAGLNLRWNPFGEVPQHERGQLAVPAFDVAAAAANLRKGGFALELIGPSGRGKSTHLHAVHRHFTRMPVTYIEIGVRRMRIPQAPVVFVDESQRLSFRARRRLFRRRVSFVLATHESHVAELEEAGVRAQRVRVGGVDARRVRAMVTRRIEWARLAPGALPTVPSEHLTALAQEHRDDLRALGDALYDWFQVRKESRLGAL